MEAEIKINASDIHQRFKENESELLLLKLANQQLMEENQTLSSQMETVLQENTTKIEVIVINMFIYTW